MSTAKKTADKVAASVHIKDAPRMTKRGRKDIADWLRHTADDLEEHGVEYSPGFRARYWYSEAIASNTGKKRHKKTAAK